MDTPLVSLITYCFNGERFVHKYFEGVLAQTYPNVELFFYNNGSKDRTGEIAESYRERLLEKGYIVNIEHYEENQCTCELKQKALLEMHGEFFCGCDSDDVMYPEHISHMVEYLQNNPEKGIVFCGLNIINEETGNSTGVMRMRPQTHSGGAFEDCLASVNTIYTPIGYLMKTELWDFVNPGRKIHLTRYGENYQVLLPFLYHNLQGYLDEVLGDYLVRTDSYTGTLDYRKRIVAFDEQEKTIIATLNQIEPDNKQELITSVQKRLRKERLHAAVQLKDTAEIRKATQACKEVGAYGLKERLYKNQKLYSALRKVKNIK